MQPHPKNDLLYLLRILEAVEKINLYAGPFRDPHHFFEANDGKEFNACLMMLAQIGEQCARVSEELKAKYTNLNWKEMKDFRNRAVHDYTGLDRFITFEVIRQHVPLLKQSISTVVKQEVEQGGFDPQEYQVAKTSPYLKHVDFSFIEQQ